MQGNPFLAYLETHRTAGAGEIKELFRVLAKRTHPDTSAADAGEFIALQEHYHAALGALIERAVDVRADPASGIQPRDRLLTALYRYKALLPSLRIDGRDLPPACMAAYRAALEAAGEYSPRAEEALQAYDRRFHRSRADIAGYPDIRVKYPIFLNALSAFFDYQLMPNAFNLRICRSYLAEIRPVTDLDPSASPLMRHNRSAAARSALYRMRVWLEEEVERPVANLL